LARRLCRIISKSTSFKWYSTSAGPSGRVLMQHSLGFGIATERMGSQRLNTSEACAGFHYYVPNHVWRDAISPDRPVLVYQSKQAAARDGNTFRPSVNCALTQAGIGTELAAGVPVSKLRSAWPGTRTRKRRASTTGATITSASGKWGVLEFEVKLIKRTQALQKKVLPVLEFSSLCYPFWVDNQVSIRQLALAGRIRCSP
jgi:hypothetical protein